MSPAKIFVIIICLLCFMLPFKNSDRVYAFRPAPPAATPQIDIIKGNIKNLQFEEFNAKIKIFPNAAEVEIEYVLLFTGKKEEELTLRFGINTRGEEVDIIVNSGIFKYTHGHQELAYRLQPNERLKIKIKYSVNTRYVFSGPPADWSSEEKFVVSTPLKYYLDEELIGEEKFPSIYSAQWKTFAPLKCYYRIEIPKGYNINICERDKEWTTVDEENGIMLYELDTKEECPGVEISKPNEANKIYTVDELVESNIQEGIEVFITGRYNAKLISAGPDYEGPGGGSYLFGEEKDIYFEFKEGDLKTVKLNQIITVKGKVGYCGGKKIAKYICRLTDARLVDETVKIYSVDELINSKIAEGEFVKVKGIAGDCVDLEVGEDYEGPGSGCRLKGDNKYVVTENFNLNEYKDKEITISGKVGVYCGGKKVPKYLCRLTNVELIQIVPRRENL